MTLCGKQSLVQQLLIYFVVVVAEHAVYKFLTISSTLPVGSVIQCFHDVKTYKSRDCMIWR